MMTRTNALVGVAASIFLLTGVALTGCSDQTKQALSNLAELLKTEGYSMNDVVKTTVFLTNMDNFDVMNREYQKHFLPPRPARSAVAVKELPRVANVELLVEIEAVVSKENT